MQPKHSKFDVIVLTTEVILLILLHAVKADEHRTMDIKSALHPQQWQYVNDHQINPGINK